MRAENAGPRDEVDESYPLPNTMIDKDRAMVELCDRINQRLTDIGTRMDALLFLTGALIGDLVFLFLFVVGRAAG